jgi:hypothetical protein
MSQEQMRLKLSRETVVEILSNFKNSAGLWKELIQISFLKQESKEKYLALLDSRCGRLKIEN